MTTTERTAIQRFMDALGIRGSVEWIDARTDGVEWGQPDATHYRCTFTRDGFDGSWPVEWSQGSLVEGAPEPRQVLSTIASDIAHIFEAPTIDDWLAEYGYLDGEPQSHARGHAAWNQIHSQRNDLISLLGGDGNLFDRLVYETETADDE